MVQREHVASVRRLVSRLPHIARVTGVGPELVLQSNDFFLQPADPQLVLVLHAAETLFDGSNIRPDVCVALTLAEDISNAAAGRSPMT